MPLTTAASPLVLWGRSMRVDLLRVRYVLWWASLLFGIQPSYGAEPSKVPALPRAHAHNDYLHKRPLLDALSHGFCNVEADVFLVDGELLVGHSRAELKPDRTLKRFYLQPLRDRLQANHGHVYASDVEFTLMIDFKTAAEPTYLALQKSLEPFHDMVTSVRDGVVERRAVSIVLSGNRPIELVKQQSTRWVAIDGRPIDLDSDAPQHLIPWISDSWSNHFRWNGRGEMPANERTKLQSLVDRAHARGCRIRFWAAPDQSECWSVLAAAGVDLINTDNLAGLAEFFRSKSADAPCH